MHIPELIADLALMLIVAGVMTILFKKLKQPLVLGYIIAGFIVGPYFNLFPAVTDTVSINTWSEIGIIMLMFSLGLEFNLHKMASVGGTGIITAITEVVSMLLLGFACGQLMGWSVMDSVFLGGMLSMSSTTIIIKAFEDLKLKGKKFTELVFGTLIIEDIAGIFMMVVLSTIAVSQGISGGALAGSLVKMLFYLALWLLLGIYLIPTFLKKTKDLMNDETLLIVSLGMCFGMVMLANYLGFSSALGAFLAGSLLAGTIHVERIEHFNKPIKDLFGAIFFISVGMLVDPALILQYAVPILLLTVVTVFGKAFFSSLGVLLSGQSLNTSIHCGCSLAQIGEFSFIIAALGISLGVMSDFIYPVIVSVSVITTFTTPFVIRASDGVYGFMDKHLPSRLSNYLNRYTSEEQSETEKDGEWAAYIKKFFSRLALYTVIMAGVIWIGVRFLWPFLAEHLQPTLAAVLATALIIAVMAPFLRQALFQKNEYFVPLWFKSKSNHLPLLALTVLRLALMTLLLALPIRIIFSLPPAYLLLVAVPIIVFISRSDWLVGPYLRVEARFLANLNEIQLEERKKADPGHSWLDEQLYVSKMICEHDSLLLNTYLSKLSGSAWSGVKIIKIIREGKHINIPEALDKLLLGDIVYIVGKMEQLENLQTVTKIELERKENGEYATLHDFIQHQEKFAEADQLLCYAVTVEKGMSLIGVSIKDSKIKSDWGAILLGLERELLPIPIPNINMRLQENDIIWVIGSQKMAGKLAKANLL